MESPTHCTTAEGEQELDLGDLIDFHSEMPILLYSPDLLTWENISPNLLSLICSLPQRPLCWILSAPPLTLSPPSVAWARCCSANLQLHWRQDCRIPRLCFSLRGPDSASLLRPSSSTMASISLVSTGAPQSTSSTGLPRPSSSALVSRPPTSTSGLHSSSCASSLCWAPPQSFVAPAPPRPSGPPPTPTPRSLKPPAPPWPSGSSALPGVVSRSSIMAPPSIGSTVGHHHDCGLGL
ncbi:hypothetical protein M9458_026201, partial [Cirrhinus mrigala]